MKQITQVINALPTAPDSLGMTRDEYNIAAVAFDAAQKVRSPQFNTFATQANELATEVNDHAVAVAADAATVAADKAIVAADKATVIADMNTVAADKAIVAADKATVIADMNTVAADKATTIAARDKAASWAEGLGEIEAGKYSAKFWAEQSHAAATGQLIYRGHWDASGNTYPTVPAPVTGDFYKITVAGVLGGVPVNPKDDILFNGTDWDHFDNTDDNKADLAGNSAQAFNAAKATSPTQVVRLDQLDPAGLYRLDALSPVFVKTGAGTISIKAGTSALCFGTKTDFLADTAVVMPTLTNGTDYAIYICTNGTVRADASFTAPTGYTVANSRLIGGFHYGLVIEGTTVAGGSFATAGTGMIWTQPDVDNLAGINKHSIWDLKFRSKSSDPQFRGQKGFAYSPLANAWFAIYYASTDTDANGLSKYNTNIASGTVLPKIPESMGGNGVTTYATPTWWDFNEIASAYGGRFILDAEFDIVAFGVTENQSIGGASSTYPSTGRSAGYTSRIGLEQATGHHWIWGADAAGASSTAWVANGGRGQSHADTLRRVLLGGNRGGAANSGSRCSSWNNSPSYVYWYIGLRAACDHLQLA